jgi:CheY-like chemotaxis protein
MKPERASSPRVLVVEDDPRICDVLEYALKADGYRVEIVHRGREAIERCRCAEPALLVLDVGLPDVDGFEVCRQIRKSSDVPVIFLTSRSDDYVPICIDERSLCLSVWERIRKLILSAMRFHFAG